MQDIKAVYCCSTLTIAHALGLGTPCESNQLVSVDAEVAELHIELARGQLEELAERIPEAAEVVLEDPLGRERGRLRLVHPGLVPW